MGGNGREEVPAGLQMLAQVGEQSGIVLDVLQHVEKPGGIEAAGEEAGVLQGGADDGGKTAAAGFAGALVAGLDEYRVETRCQQSMAHEAVAAADVPDRPPAVEAMDHRDDAPVAVVEPEGFVFEGHASRA